MRIRVTRNDLSRVRADLAVAFACEGDKEPRGVADAALRKKLAARMKADHFEGKAGDRAVWNSDGEYPSGRYLILGLGAGKPVVGEALRSASARAAREADRFKAGTLALCIAEKDPAEVRAAIEGAMLGAYSFDRHLTDSARKATPMTRVEVASPAPATRALKEAQATGEGIALARDLVNEAPSRMNPTAFARAAAAAAKRSGLSCKVLGPAEIRKLGMHAILAVARGSSEPPRVVHLTYRPKTRGPKTQRIVLVGKGVTFDSGGLNLKPGEYMTTMKSDMGGAAAVLGAMTTLRDLNCKAEVHALLGLTENMTGGAAYKPGDIIDTYSGKSVEIGNTDAEGRLVMCDLLAHAAKKLRPTTMIDVATLTGAVVVALGLQATGLFTRFDDLRDELLEASRAGGEKFWPLPMYDEYLQELQKGPADLNNVGSRWGGATTAALFLGEFLPRDLRWAHLDIAGPAFAETDTPELRIGGTGAGVSTLVRWLQRC